MSKRASRDLGVVVTLAPDQVLQVVQQAIESGGIASALGGLATTSEMTKLIQEASLQHGSSRSLLRGLLALAVFSESPDPRGLIEVATVLGMSPSTTHRYLITLVQAGLLERDSTSRRYRLSTPLRRASQG